MAIFNVTVRSRFCDQPQNFAVSNITDSSFMVNWDIVQDAVGYRIELTCTSINGNTLDTQEITLDNGIMTLDNGANVDITLDSGLITLDTDTITLDVESITRLRKFFITSNNQFLIDNLSLGNEYSVRVQTLCTVDESIYTDPIEVMLANQPFDFRASNATIRVSNTNLRISELQITQDEV